MPKADDPYYNRKQVPAEFIKDVGYTGLSPAEEYATRERKYSVEGGDIRKFSNKLEPQSDPYYGRKRVSDAEAHGVGDTGLTPEEEFLNRERKYSASGFDVRKFSSKLAPPSDPYYNRTKVPVSQTAGVGETYNTPAADFEVRERKQSVANFSGDPFAILAGSGHRQSVAAGPVAGAAAEATRRRSSAVGPHAATATATHGHHSGYGGDDRLAPITSKPELPPVNVDSIEDRSAVPTSTTHTTTTTAPGTTTSGVTTGHAATDANGLHEHVDPDSVAPHEVR